jgi:hypothetical protein
MFVYCVGECILSVYLCCRCRCAHTAGMPTLLECLWCIDTVGIYVQRGLLPATSHAHLLFEETASQTRRSDAPDALEARARWGPGQPAKCVEVHGRPTRDSCCRLPAPARRFVSHSRGLVRTKASYRRQYAGGQAGATEPIDLGAAGRGAGS